MMVDQRVFRPCSGQSPHWTGRKNDWSVCRVDNNPPWWRANNKAGHQCFFPSFEAAESAALKLETTLTEELANG